MSSSYVNFYGYNDVDGGFTPLTPADNDLTDSVKDVFAKDLKFVASDDGVNVVLDDTVISTFTVPDKVGLENATYDDATKTMKFDSDDGTETVDLSGLSDVYTNGDGISVDSDKKVSVKYDDDTLKINEDGELEAIHKWGTI